MRASYCFRLLAVLSCIALPTQAFAVFTADEICAPTDDPCVISCSISVNSGAYLDFGLRSVEIVSNGQLDLGNGEATLLCGSFSAEGATSPGIKARGPSGARYALEPRSSPFRGR